MTHLPKVSVILAVYNGAEFLNECINSIRNQTLSAFEFIIVDDASTDRTPDILKYHVAEDKRIVVLTNERNKERSISRNIAIKSSSTDLIAVMDADDIAEPDRLEKQYAFMTAHPEISLCGSFMSYLSSNGIWSGVCDDVSIRARMLFECPIAHPTVMFRRAVVMNVGGYDENMSVAEDYILWGVLAENVSIHFANIPELLVRYRTYPHLARQEYYQKQREGARLVHKKLLQQLDLPCFSSNLDLHWLCTGYYNLSIVDLVRADHWLSAILNANEQYHIFDHTALVTEISERRSKLRMQVRTVKPFLQTIWRLLPDAVRFFVRDALKRS